MNTHVTHRMSAQHTIHLFIILTLIAWFSLVLLLALEKLFDSPPGTVPVNVILSLLLPVVIFALAYTISEQFRGYVLNIDTRHLILLHSWRMLGIAFIFLYFFELLPALFAFPAGLGDALAAIFAVFLVIKLYSRHPVSPKWIYRWNVFALLDFVLAVSLGVISRTGNIGNFSGHVSSDIMGTLPLVMIPGFIVPFYIITHIIIFLQLHNRNGSGNSSLTN